MTSKTTNSQSSLNFLTPSRAVLEIHGSPDLSFNCTTFAIPSISTNSPKFATPLTDIPMRGDTLVYAPLDITFLVKEDLSNWIRAVEWLEGLTAPRHGSQFTNKKLEYSDATIFIYSSHNNVMLEVKFNNLVPTHLGAIRFDTTNDGVQEITADLTMEYQNYEINGITRVEG